MLTFLMNISIEKKILNKYDKLPYNCLFIYLGYSSAHLTLQYLFDDSVNLIKKLRKKRRDTKKYFKNIKKKETYESILRYISPNCVGYVIYVELYKYFNNDIISIIMEFTHVTKNTDLFRDKYRRIQENSGTTSFGDIWKKFRKAIRYYL